MNSHERRRLLRSGVVKESKTKIRKPPRVKPHKGRFVEYFAVGKLILAILGIGGTILSYAALKTSVSIEPYSSQDPRNPFYAQFSIQNNNSIYSIYRVSPGCVVQSVRSGLRGSGNFALSVKDDFVFELASGAKTTTTCPLEKSLDNSPLSYDELRIGIWVAYKLPFGMSRCLQNDFIVSQ